MIEANGGEVVLEEYYPIDQPEYSATVKKIRDGGAAENKVRFDVIEKYPMVDPKQC